MKTLSLAALAALLLATPALAVPAGSADPGVPPVAAAGASVLFLNPSALYDWTGTAWTPHVPAPGASSAQPSYTQPLNGGSVVNQGNPLSVATSEPSTFPFSLSAAAAFAVTQATLYGYAEADIDVYAVGTGGTIQGQESEDGVHWNNPNCYRSVGGPPGLLVTTFTYAGQFACTISQTYFRWNLTGTITGTYSGYTSFRTHRAASSATIAYPTGSAFGGATGWYYLPNGSAASNNATMVVAGSHTLYSMVLTGAAANAWLKLYNGATTPTCSSATGLLADILIGPSVTLQISPGPGAYFNNGIGFCIVGGSASTDNSNAPAGVGVTMVYQ